MKNILKRFLNDDAGSLLIMFAVMLPILVIAIGGFIDFGASTVVHSELNAASDAAGIIASKSEFTLSKRKEMAKRYYTANYSDASFGVVVKDSDVNVSEKKGVISVDATPSGYKPLFLQLAGIKDIPVNANTKIVTAAAGDMDIVFVLDNSGSMNDPAASPLYSTRLEALKASSIDFVNQVIDDSYPNVRISLTTFNRSSQIALGYSNNTETLTERINNMRSNGSTCGACGLQNATSVLNGSSAAHTERADERVISKNKVVILFSDGEFNRETEYDLDAQQAILNAAIQGIDAANIVIERTNAEITRLNQIINDYNANPTPSGNPRYMEALEARKKGEDLLKKTTEIKNEAQEQYDSARAILDAAEEDLDGEGSALDVATSIIAAFPNVRIYTITLAGDIESMRQIATFGEDGRKLYFPAGDEDQLRATFNQIAGVLGKLRMVE